MSNRAVAEELDIDKAAASRRVRAATDRDYLKNLEDRKGHSAKIVFVCLSRSVLRLRAQLGKTGEHRHVYLPAHGILLERRAISSRERSGRAISIRLQVSCT